MIQGINEEELKMKKKICMLALAMTLSMTGLVACGENAEETTVESTVEATTEEATTEEATTEEATTEVETETAAN